MNDFREREKLLPCITKWEGMDLRQMVRVKERVSTGD
jgi:hypothetical protein